MEETAPIAGDPPKFDWPSIPNDSQTISTMLSFAIQLAAIGAVESVLTLQACNEITDTVPKISDSNQECFAQGLANLVCGLFRGKLVCCPTCSAGFVSALKPTFHLTHTTTYRYS